MVGGRCSGGTTGCLRAAGWGLKQEPGLCVRRRLGACRPVKLLLQQEGPELDLRKNFLLEGPWLGLGAFRK